MMEMEDTRGSPPPRYESRDGRGRVPGHGGRMESPSRAARGRVAGHGRRTESPTPQQQRVRAEASSRTNTGRSRRDDGRGERREGRAPALPARRDGSMF